MSTQWLLMVITTLFITRCHKLKTEDRNVEIQISLGMCQQKATDGIRTHAYISQKHTLEQRSWQSLDVG